jgi:hypothetical protein
MPVQWDDADSQPASVVPSTGGGEATERGAQTILDGLKELLSDSLDESKIREVVDQQVEKHSGSLTELADKVKDELVRLAKEQEEKLKELRAPKPDHFFVTVGDGKKTKVDGQKHPCFETIMRILAVRDGDNHSLPVMMIGPTGSGKTFIGKQIADALNVPFDFISLSGGVSEGKLVGFHGLQGWVEGKFSACYGKPGVFLFDEFDAADDNVIISINAALANGHLAKANGEVVKRHPENYILLALNTFGHGADQQYVGRNQLDAATIDRFLGQRIFMDYARDLERDLCNPFQLSREVLKWGWSIRQKNSQNRIKHPLSTRTLLNGCRLVGAFEESDGKAGLSVDEWQRSVLADYSDDELAMVGESRRDWSF